MFLKAVLDTTVYGPKVHTTFLLKEDMARKQTGSGSEQECPTTNYQHIAYCSSEVSPTASSVSIRPFGLFGLAIDYTGIY